VISAFSIIVVGQKWLEGKLKVGWEGEVFSAVISAIKGFLSVTSV
jgi:hypothetical protein